MAFIFGGAIRGLFAAAKVATAAGLFASNGLAKLGMTKWLRSMTLARVANSLSIGNIKTAIKEVGFARYFVPPGNFVGIKNIFNIHKLPTMSKYIESNHNLLRSEVDKLKNMIPEVYHPRLGGRKVLDSNIDETLKSFFDGKIGAKDFGKKMLSATTDKIPVDELISRGDYNIADRVKKINLQAHESRKLIGTKMVSNLAVIGIPSIGSTYMQYKLITRNNHKIRNKTQRSNRKLNQYTVQ